MGIKKPVRNWTGWYARQRARLGISGYACTLSQPQPVRLWWRWVLCENAEMLIMWLEKNIQAR